MALARPVLAAAAAILLASAGARADDAPEGDPGADPGGDPGASAIVSPAANALVAIRRSEPRSEVAASVGGAVVDRPATTVSGVAVPARNGLQRGALELQGSWAPSPRWELFATFNALAFRWLTIGTTDDRQASVGSATVGATWVPLVLPGGRLYAGAFLRVLLPTSQEVGGVHAWGVQPGLTLRGVATRWLVWYGGLSFRVSQSWGTLTTPLATRSADATQTGASAMAGVALVPASWLRVVAQCSANFPFQRAPDQFSPGLGVRFVEGDFGAELGALIPVGGHGQTFSAVARVSWRLDPATP